MKSSQAKIIRQHASNAEFKTSMGRTELLSVSSVSCNLQSFPTPISDASHYKASYLFPLPSDDFTTFQGSLNHNLPILKKLFHIDSTPKVRKFQLSFVPPQLLNRTRPIIPSQPWYVDVAFVRSNDPLADENQQGKAKGKHARAQAKNSATVEEYVYHIKKKSADAPWAPNDARPMHGDRKSMTKGRFITKCFWKVVKDKKGNPVEDDFRCNVEDTEAKDGDRSIWEIPIASGKREGEKIDFPDSDTCVDAIKRFFLGDNEAEWYSVEE